MKSDKNKILLICAILIILIICSVGYFLFSNKKTYITVSYDEVVEKINKNERFVLFIGSKNCSHCTMFKSTITRVVEDYNIKVYYIDISELNDEEHAYLNSHFPFNGTPTTIVVENGKEYKRQICRIEGAKNYDYVVERLKKAEIIKE